MKKFISVLLLLAMALSLVACVGEPAETTTPEIDGTTADPNGNNTDDVTTGSEVKDPAEKSEGVMTYEQYKAAAVDTEVVVECYVQANQSWWDNKITVYAADPDGAYFLYELVCSEDDAKKLTPGTKIKVTGEKIEWSGEVEISGATFEFVEDGVTYISEAKDLTEELGKDTLIDYQNQKAIFKDMTVKAIEFKNGTPGDDIYVTLTKGDKEYSFCVEFYLTNTETDVYKAVSALVAGDVIDVEGFVYWYNGVNTHITAVTKK